MMNKESSIQQGDPDHNSEKAQSTSHNNLTSQRRRYHSPLRKNLRAQTKERILEAGAQIVRSLPISDWKEIIFGGISQQLGISKRTIYRHFPTYADLREALIRRLIEESGVPSDATSEGLSAIVEQSFFYFSLFAAEPIRSPISTSIFADEIQLRRNKLTGALALEAPNWSAQELNNVAALLELLLTRSTYERLTIFEGLSPSAAVNTLKWLIRLITEAVRKDDRLGNAYPYPRG